MFVQGGLLPVKFCILKMGMIYSLVHMVGNLQSQHGNPFPKGEQRQAAGTGQHRSFSATSSSVRGQPRALVESAAFGGQCRKLGCSPGWTLASRICFKEQKLLSGGNQCKLFLWGQTLSGAGLGLTTDEDT